MISQKRPIDKRIFNVAEATAVGGTTRQLWITSGACTLVGLRWDFHIQPVAAATDATMFWALVVVPDGTSPSTISLTAGAAPYQPEQHVLAFGYYRTSPYNTSVGFDGTHVEGTTKTMRKMRNGDSLYIITKGDSSCAVIDGGVQFFCKE